MTDTRHSDDTELAGHTDVGQRKHNEDAYLVDPDLGLYIVADGVGGHHSGEVASAITIEVIRREVAAGSDLVNAIQVANAEVRLGVETGRGRTGMASTVVAMRQRGEAYELAWVGDSRAYLWDGRLKLLTRDHSQVEAQLATGAITPEEARTHPQRNEILQAIGLQGEGTISVDTNGGRLGPGNTVLLCSDGVSDSLDNEQLSQLISQHTDAQTTCKRLVTMALQSGGRDNATAVVLHYRQADGIAAGSHDNTTWIFDPGNNEYEGLAGAAPPQDTAEQDHDPTRTVNTQPGRSDAAGSMGWPGFWGVVVLGILAGLALGYALS